MFKRREGGRRRRRRRRRGGGVTRGRRQFWVSICPLIFKQQAGGVLVTDKEAGLSSHSLTSPHSALLSGRHLESRKQLRASGGGQDTAVRGGQVRVCVHLYVRHSCLQRSSLFFGGVSHLSKPSLTLCPPHACAPTLFSRS